MTDPADRFLAQQLEGELHALARGVSVPVVPADADVRRGRRRLFRMRMAMAGATTGTLAVVLGITSLTAGDPKATEIPPITQPPTTLTASPSGSSSDDSTEGASTGRSSDRTDTKTGSGPDTESSSGDTDAPDPGGPPGGAPVGAGPTGGATGGTNHGGTLTVDHQPDGGTATADPVETPASTVTPTSTPTDTPTGTPTSDPTGTPTSTPTVPPTASTRVRVHRVLRYYNDVLAEHLDPGRSHLQPYDRTIDTKETKKANGRLYALGSTYRWEGGGSRSGLEITVASGWDQVDWDCGASYSDWVCHAGNSDDTEFAAHDGVVQVAVEHTSGQVVVLTADPTYDAGRLSTDVDSSEAELAAAAADSRLILPGIAPVAPPRISVTSFSAVGLATLVKPGETFHQSGLDRSPWVRGDWTGTGGADAEHGTLAWTVEPIYSRGRFACLTTYRSCTQVTIDELGTTVHLALLKKRAGGGWLVQYDGGEYGVRVYSSNRKFPKKRAYAFVTQRTWQPDR